jgi:hypothetical protein
MKLITKNNEGTSFIKSGSLIEMFAQSTQWNSKVLIKFKLNSNMLFITWNTVPILLFIISIKIKLFWHVLKKSFKNLLMKSAQPKNQTTNFRNLMFITPKSDFSLSLQIYKTNTKFLLSKMD